MDQALVQEIERDLRAGRPQQALATAAKLCKAHGATRESGIEIAKAAATVYRELIAPPVVEFAALAAKDLPDPVGPLVDKALARLFRLNEEWEKKLWEVHTERLAREVRDWVREGHLKPAAQNISRLLALVPKEKRSARCKYVGNVLGTVLNHQKEAAKVVSLLMKNGSEFGVSSDDVMEVDRARQARASELGSIDMESLERQWGEVLTGVAIEIKSQLPDSTQMGEPDDAALRDAGDTFRSILRVPLLREDPELFLDATYLLVEFVPKQQTATAKMARVEGRTYNTLGFTAQKTVQLTFLEIGKNSFFTKVYSNWALGYVGSDCLGPIVEVMGALRSNDFSGFLKNLKGGDSSGKAVEAQVSTALGAIASEETTDELIAELRGLLHKKRFDSADMKRAEKLVSSLGQVVKSPRTEMSERHKIREFLRTHVPEDLTKLACHTAMAVFTFKAEEENAELRKWCIRALVRGLWMTDETTAMHKGEDGDSPLGFRGEIANALIRVGKLDVSTMVHTMESLTGRYGGAYIAAAEVLEKVGSPDGLLALERMLNNALLHSDSENNIYQQEMYWDSALEQRVPLTKMRVIEPLIHAIGTIGGPKANVILKRFEEQVASGRIDAPSANVAVFMDRFKKGGEFDTAGAEDEGSTAGVTNDPATVKELVKALNKGYWLTGKEKRRMQKVQALTRLAQITPLDAIEDVFSQLADKDLMVVSAAVTCLSEYAEEKQPKPMRDLCINTAVEKLEDKDPAMRQGALKLLRAIGPNRKDVKPRLLQFAKTVEKREAREALALLLKTGSGGGSPEDQLASSVESAPGGGASAMTQLELKHQYMGARQAWIRGGKKGDPPAKPEGME